MKLSDFLKIGEVNEVQGKTVKAGIYSDKNTEYLNFNGTVLKNVGIGSFVLIRKGFNNIIGKVEGENIKEMRETDKEYARKGTKIQRIISISILGGLKGEKFIHGLTELPLIGNFVYILEETTITKIFSHNSSKETVQLGKIIGYDDYPFELGVQEITCSHVGIFGNTGSGKSNTLAKLYKEIINKYKDNRKFKTNSKFIILDFNGEYGNVFPNADKYFLSTRKINSDDCVDPFTGELLKYIIPFKDIIDPEFWAIILEATEKTQRPFIKRTIWSFERIEKNEESFTISKLCNMIINTRQKYHELKNTIKDIFSTFGLGEEFDKFEDNISYNSNTKDFYTGNNNYNVSSDTIQEKVFLGNEIDMNHLYKLSIFEKFEFTMKYNYWLEISKSYIAKEHIAPLISRVNSRCRDLDKIFVVVSNQDYRVNLHKQNHIEILSLINLNLDMKKIVPMIICKTKYFEKKEAKINVLNSTLHFIIDEAHNILSEMSTRESEEWKDYRLESFEEIIKEGRKFGVFLTIASQRPSDISDTIISQLHNYFIHRLVNDEDLRKIYRTVSFADKASNDMISVLPAGGCLVSGLATNFPVLVQIDILPKEMRPKSENVDIQKVWVD